jgi:hypothetical protein
MTRRPDLARTRGTRHVWFRSFTAPEPVFHAVLPSTGRTVCGLVVWHDADSRGTLMPLRLAQRIGTACFRCWTLP